MALSAMAAGTKALELLAGKSGCELQHRPNMFAQPRQARMRALAWNTHVPVDTRTQSKPLKGVLYDNTRNTSARTIRHLGLRASA